MQEVKAPIRWRHYIGWILLTLTLAPLITLSLYLHIKENREMATEQDAAKWQTNWAQLKVGMSKEEVLTLVGAPTSTIVQAMKVTTVTTDPSDPKIQDDVQQALANEANYAIWSYYGPIVIHTSPNENLKTAEGDGEIQLSIAANLGGDSRLHGHAIKFNATGQIIEISPQ